MRNESLNMIIITTLMKEKVGYIRSGKFTDIEEKINATCWCC